MLRVCVVELLPVDFRFYSYVYTSYLQYRRIIINMQCTKVSSPYISSGAGLLAACLADSAASCYACCGIDTFLSLFRSEGLPRTSAAVTARRGKLKL